MVREDYKKRFVNPYNFIPLMEKCERSEPEQKQGDSYTGYFECSMRLLTPLFIPNTSSSQRLLKKEKAIHGNSQEQQGKGYDFFSYEDLSKEPYNGAWPPPPPAEPVIPGSEIRGAVRSVYEAAFNGCLSSLSEDLALDRGSEKTKKTIKGLLKANGGYQPCSDKDLCPACQIFGIVEKAQGSHTFAYGSKVRITDAKLINPEENKQTLFGKPIILPELGQPRPSTVEFYTKSPYEKEETINRQGYWTYDYKRKFEDGKVVAKQTLDANQPELRGRKYYWHSCVNLEKYKYFNDVSAMKQRIRPMIPQDTKPIFSFRVYFEQMSKQQLSCLKWALDFGDPACAHKLGRAKPLGFGSVRLSVDRLSLREISRDTGQWQLKQLKPEAFCTEPVPSNAALKTLQLMANWEKKPVNVQYPPGKAEEADTNATSNDKASHQWFQLNQKTGSFKKVLPAPEEEVRENPDQSKVLFKLTNSNKRDGKVRGS